MTFNSLKIQEKYNDIGALPCAEGRSPSLVRKFTRWIEQIAGLEEKEKKLIGEITAIEEKHRQMRKAKRLRRASPAAKGDLAAPKAEEEPKSRFWWWILLFMFLTTRSKKAEAPKNG